MPAPERSSKQTTRRPPPSKGRRIAWWVGGAVALGAIAVAVLLLMQRGRDERQAQEEAEYAEAQVLSVEELVAAWRQDSRGFDAKHKGRALGVVGPVGRVETMEAAYGGGTVRVVRLQGPDSLEVACWFSPAEAALAAGMTPGSRVTLVGRWSGEGNSSQEVVLRFCRPR